MGHRYNNQEARVDTVASSPPPGIFGNVFPHKHQILSNAASLDEKV
jgi:hypothetical protein